MSDILVTAPYVWAAVTIWPVVCTAIVAARLATRRAQRSRFGWDDWLCIPALILVLGMTVTIIVALAQRGLGYPSPPPQPGQNGLSAASGKQTISRKAFAAVFSLQTPALTCIKLSCVIFYKRVFCTRSFRAFDLFVWIFAILVIIWGIGFFFAFLFSCGKNFRYLWTSVQDELSCPANFGMIDLGNAISNVIMDAILFIVPIPMVLKLQMSRSRKMALLGVFTIGAAAIAMSALRLALWNMELHATLGANADQILVTTVGIYFQYIETCFALCAICLPTLSGALKLRIVQSTISRVSSVFSNSSLASSRSGSGNRKADSRDNGSFSEQSTTSSTSETLHSSIEKPHLAVGDEELGRGGMIIKSQSWQVHNVTRTHPDA